VFQGRRAASTGALAEQYPILSSLNFAFAAHHHVANMLLNDRARRCETGTTIRCRSTGQGFSEEKALCRAHADASDARKVFKK
jgi:hypothetical protein